jgi:predicted enzyme related to lactoylglutathione lyase
MEESDQLGSVSWMDLTVPNADDIRDFYRDVVGWTSNEVDMGGYHDYCMNSPESGRTIGGICHTRGMNADMPPVWLVYISVLDLEESIQRCIVRGGKLVFGPKGMGGKGTFCVIQDPAGAYVALYETEKESA